MHAVHRNCYRSILPLPLQEPQLDVRGMRQASLIEYDLAGRRLMKDFIVVGTHEESM